VEGEGAKLVLVWLCGIGVVFCCAVLVWQRYAFNVVRESVVGTLGAGACVGPTVVGIFVCIVLVLFCTSI